MTLRSMAIRLFICLCASLAAMALPVLAQSAENQQADEGATAETMATSSETVEAEAADAMIDVEAIVALPFGSYDTDWMRFKNGELFARPILHIDGISQYPFRVASVKQKFKLVDLADLQLKKELIRENALAYSEDAILGICDSKQLAKYGSSDIYCEPGSSVLPPGHAYLTLYNPQTLEIVALTETIYNLDSIATRADEWRDIFPSPADQPAAQPQAAGGALWTLEWRSVDHRCRIPSLWPDAADCGSHHH